MKWRSCKYSYPPNGQVVLTRFEEPGGTVVEQRLVRYGNKWYAPDRVTLVMYFPTDWHPDVTGKEVIEIPNTW